MKHSDTPGLTDAIRQEAQDWLNRGNAFQDAQDFVQAIVCYDRSIALNPDFALAHNNRANAAKKLGRYEEALKGYERSLALNPGLASAHFNRANALRDLDRLEDAIESYQKALSISSSMVGALCNRATVLQRLGRFEEALDDYDRAILLQPDDPLLHSNRGNTLAALQRDAEAVSSFDRALGLNPQYAEASYNKSLLLLTQGNFRQGWPMYESRWSVRSLFEPRSFSRPPWRGEQNIKGQRILLHSEQGFGDTIQFCRYAPRLRFLGANIILEAPRELVPLLKTLSAGISVIATGDPLPSFDLHCSLMSLPAAFSTELRSIPASTPYLRADPDLVARWNRTLGKKRRMRVGIAWSGRRTHPNDRLRSIHFPLLRPLFDLDFDFHVLQNEIREADRSWLLTIPSLHWHADQLRDFSETAALASKMDLVVSVDTSVAHMAGALGLPLFILLPYAADFRWLRDRTDSPWYPSARLFRQKPGLGWPEVLEQVVEALDKHH